MVLIPKVPLAHEAFLLSAKSMKHCLCTLIIVAFTTCSALHMVAKPGDRHFGDSEPVNAQVGVAPQSPAFGGSAADPVLKATSQPGRTAGVRISSANVAIAHRG